MTHGLPWPVRRPSRATGSSPHTHGPSNSPGTRPIWPSSAVPTLFRSKWMVAFRPSLYQSWSRTDEWLVINYCHEYPLCTQLMARNQVKLPLTSSGAMAPSPSPAPAILARSRRNVPPFQPEVPPRMRADSPPTTSTTTDLIRDH